MSDRRWWSLPKMFAFPLWSHSHDETTTGSQKAREPVASDDDDDIEEFLEKQRNVRLGYVEVAAPGNAASNRKYSSEEDRGEDRRFARSRSRRRNSRSSSKSSGSTKYSSFSKTSDAENEKTIKETIYEMTGATQQISFSFFNDSNKSVAENEDRLYGNINETVIEEEKVTADDAVSLTKTEATDAQQERVSETNTDQAEDRRTNKERHVTKLTILLTPVKDVETNDNSEEANIDSTMEEKHDGSVTMDTHMQNEPAIVGSNEGDDNETIVDENPLYSVVERNLRKNSTAESENPDYAELSEFHTSTSPETEVPGMDYCTHRARVKTRMRKISLRRKRKPQPSLKKMNLRINKAWQSLRGWWQEEKTRLGQLRPKSFVKADREEESASSCSEKSFYTSIKHLNVIEHQSTNGRSEEDGYCSLEPHYSGSLKAKEKKCEDGRRKSCIAELSSVRRYPPHPPPPRTAGVNAFRKSRYYPPQGQDGFEDLRRYIKQGGDFCKELSAILQERSEAEIQYAKTLSKLSSKLLKASKEAVGTVSQAWHKAGIELETTSEIHKTFATALCEEVVKPLKQLIESQHRIRKSVENAVDKTGKNLSEWRTAESKSKKQSFVSARENEKLQDVTLDVRLSGGLTGTNKLTASSLHLHQKQGSEKESSKLETKRKKAEELVKKSDVEYYTYCIRAERARLEWETAVVRGSQCFQALEEERLQQLKHLAFVYWQHCRDIGPKLTQSALRLKDPIESCNVATDIKTIASTKGIEQPVSEQLLPDFYAEHTTLAMNRDRRRQALVKVLQLIVQDLERERRGKNGVENLARAFKQSPNFGNDDSQQNVSEKLHHMRFMLTYLEAARYKISCALAELDGNPKPSHPLATHIHVIRDRQGFQQSILKVPQWVHKETIEQTEQVESPDWTDRGTADGNSVQPDSDFDEFSSQGSSEKDFEGNVFTVIPESTVSTPTPSAGGRCRALYNYTANLYDELNLQPGDIINIHDKQPDGWWLGELNGVVGIFPATYVEEIS